MALVPNQMTSVFEQFNCSRLDGHNALLRSVNGGTYVIDQRSLQKLRTGDD
jgi:hypothetical protein